MPKANLWIIDYCILEIKADNEPAINLSFTKKHKTKQKDQKKGKESFQRRESNPGPSTYGVQ